MTRETGACRRCVRADDCQAGPLEIEENERGEVAKCRWRVGSLPSGMCLALALVGCAVMVEEDMKAWWFWAAGIALLLAFAVAWQMFGGKIGGGRRKNDR